MTHTPVSLLEGPRFRDDTPAWWRERRTRAWERFAAAPMPTRKDEDWRFANVGALSLDAFRHPSEPAQAAAAAAALPPQEFGSVASLVFANDDSSSPAPLPDDLAAAGVIFEPLSRAIANRRELLEKYFMANPVDLGSAKFEALHEACAGEGYLLFVPDNIEIALPFSVVFGVAGRNSAVFPHALIVAGENSRVTVIEQMISLSDAPAFVSVRRDVFAGPGSAVQVVASQNLTETSTLFQAISSSVGRDASCQSLQMNLGGSFVRSENRSRLIGPGARSEMLALAVAHGRQEFDQRTLQDHLSPNTWSDLLYKNALNHQAKTIFQGLIKVEPNAAHTDAYQTNRNLILCPSAEADSLPGLEILNDDVKCSHGATTGEVDREQLFYLQARGIHPAQAKHLLVVGFFEEVLARLGREPVAAYLLNQVEEKFTRSENMVFSPQTDASEEIADGTDIRALQGTR